MSFLGALALSLGAAPAFADAPVRPDNTWVPLGALPERLDSPVFAIAVSPIDSATVLVGTGSGTVFRSTDQGNTWTAVGHGLGRGVLTIQFSPFKPGTVYAGTRGDGLWRSGDGGATWAKQPGVPNATVRSVGFAKSMTLVGSDAGLFSSHDGASWAPYLSFSPLSLNAIAVAAVNDPPKFLAGADASRNDEVLPLYVSQDGGTSWSNVKSLGSSTMVGAAAAGGVPAGGQSRPLVVGTNAGAFISTDGGTSWAQAPGLPAIDFTAAAFLANHTDRFYLASDGGGTSSGGLWTSSDAGASFRSLAAPLGSVTALALTADDAPTVYSATFRSSDRLVMLWAYHDTGGAPVAPSVAIPPAASFTVYQSSAPLPAARPLTLRALIASSEAPYLGLGLVSILVLLTALFLQFRRGRD